MTLSRRSISVLGIVLTLTYGTIVVWLYVTEPRNWTEVATGAEIATGIYKIDQNRFQTGLDLFRVEQYEAAREQWKRADPGNRDPLVQFYIAYAFYRQGWGRLYHDDALYRQGLEAAEKALQLTAPDGPLVVDDAGIQIHTPAELKAELEAGLNYSADDLNPFKVFRGRR